MNTDHALYLHLKNITFNKTLREPLMKTKTVLLFLFFLVTANSFASAPISDRAPEEISTYGKSEHDSALAVLIHQSPKAISKLLGRKLTFKEKISLTLLKWKGNKIPPDERVYSRDGNTAQTLGIIALAALLVFPLASIPLGILAITKGNKALRENENDGAARTGKTLGIISLSLFAVLILVIIALLSSLQW